jgi:sporulation protein YlmC with PRC-barrel domain
MFNTVGHLTTAHVRAFDGDIGPIKFALFDDRDWVVRYLVVDAGAWLAERDVLVSPYSVKQPMGSGRSIDVALTRRLVRASPALEPDVAVSRVQEQQFERHYHYPAYWNGGGLWALGATPLPSMAPPPGVDAPNLTQYPAGMQLRSTDALYGFEICGSGHAIGTVQDLVFDEESWQIHYLVTDTSNWWPGGRRVLIARTWVDGVDWGSRQIHVDLTRQQLRNSPTFQDVASIRRDYEVLLHDTYARPGYWAVVDSGPMPSMKAPS